MLVVDLHALHTVHVLHLVYKILLNACGALNIENVTRGDRSIAEGLTGLHEVVLLHEDVLAQRHEVELVLASAAFHDDLTVAPLDLAIGNDTIDLADHCRVAGVTGLEEFRNTGQTTGDVTAFAGAAWDLHEDIACLHFVAFAYHDVCTHGQGVALDLLLALGVDDLDGGVLALVAAFHDDLLGESGLFVDLLTIGHAFLDALEAQFTGKLGDDDGVVRIPLADHLAFLHLLPGLAIEHGPIRDVAGGKHDAGVVVHDAHFGAAADDHFGVLALAVLLLHRTQLVDLQFTVILGHDLAVLGDLARHTTDVECAKGKLRTRFSDGLCGDHADGLTDLDHAARGKVAAVALRTNAMALFAGQYAAHLHLFDRATADNVRDLLTDGITAGDDQLTGLGMQHIMHDGAAQDPVAQAFHYFLVLQQVGRHQAAKSTAVVVGDHYVLRHVHQSAGEVTGVSGLQRGIGQAFTRTVGGDEILQDGQSFLEVRKDGVLDDVLSAAALLRLGHQAAHAAELTDLLF